MKDAMAKQEKQSALAQAELQASLKAAHTAKAAQEDMVAAVQRERTNLQIQNARLHENEEELKQALAAAKMQERLEAEKLKNETQLRIDLQIKEAGLEEALKAAEQWAAYFEEEEAQAIAEHQAATLAA